MMRKLFATAALFAAAGLAHADNPIIQNVFTADPAPIVHDGTVYLYTSHDEDDAKNFHMLDWRCYSSTDMVNWTDHGSVASLATFPWAVQSNDAWAPMVIERDGKFYLYVPISVPGWPKNVIAVAVADNPLGPFKDALGKPLIDKANGYIDPNVIIDDDGQAYLYWGNPNVWYVKLNKDMISTEGEIVKEPTKPKNYQEGPWVYHRGDHYYLTYASTCCPEGIGYAMSDSVTGPWEYKGYIVPPDQRSSGNHPGIIDYKGNTYVFGFNYLLNFRLTKEHRERRSVCVTEMHFNPDGTIQELPWWDDGKAATQLHALDPYQRTEAETIAWGESMESEKLGEKGMVVYPTKDGAYIKVAGVDFGDGAKSFAATLSCDAATTGGATAAGAIELRLDAPDGTPIGTLPVGPTAGEMKTEKTDVKGASGKHDLFLVFRGGLANHVKFDSWQFSK